MYAIVKTGGKQYRVERGQHLLVERLPAAEGASVALEPIMYRSEEAIFDAEGLKEGQGLRPRSWRTTAARSSRGSSSGVQGSRGSSGRASASKARSGRATAEAPAQPGAEATQATA